MSSNITTLQTSTSAKPEGTLSLTGAALESTDGASYSFAGAPPTAEDPDAFPAGNDPTWDYSVGNPPNAAWQDHNWSSRSNGSTRTLVLMAGVNVVGVSPHCISTFNLAAFNYLESGRYGRGFTDCSV